MFCENLKTSTTGLSSKSRQLTPNGRGFTSSNFPPPKYNIPRLARDVSVTHSIIIYILECWYLILIAKSLTLIFSSSHHEIQIRLIS